MKLAALLAIAAPLLAADKKPEDLKAAVLAADKAAKDAAGSGLGARELEEKDKPNGDKAAKDKAAKDKAAKDKAAADKAAKDAVAAEDRDDDPEHTNDADMDAEDIDMGGEDEGMQPGDPSTPGGNRAAGKTAIDSAEVDRRIAAAVSNDRALRTAHDAVEPILGKIAFDSAPKAYRAALDALNVDTKGVPNSALPAMLKLAKDRAAPAALAMDAGNLKTLETVIPGYGRLR